MHKKFKQKNLLQKIPSVLSKAKVDSIKSEIKNLKTNGY